MTKHDLDRVVDDKETVLNILDAMKDVRLFCTFESTLKLGVTIDANSLPFERIMVFGWIKELINGK